MDVRPRLETYGQWIGVNLSSEKKNMFYVPADFAHGFLVLSDTAEFVYKCIDVVAFEIKYRFNAIEIDKKNEVNAEETFCKYLPVIDAIPR